MSRELDEKVARALGVSGRIHAYAIRRVGGGIAMVGDVYGVSGISFRDVRKFVDAHPEAYRYEERETFKPYSTDIAAAWQVVDRMRELGFTGFDLWRECAGGNNEWGCEIWQRGNSISQAITAFGATAPEAICRAALAALETK